ncbi:BspA family leucine-rich repeat surface protein [Bifidobacterium sp. ESL0800]|uniref:BspA family leucine-rich repeat surface protein n=1 Tax=Bifidobacterium sp. ESL0800 TaxID=2983236 RepID=UPI0023F6C562|nr:BspA family leucine-rich repeat surface protein [Bifidobacterium sp. ESL0800]WEV75152.1 BspA family leucine-rich repeat surface protein [Bifidobacterium sp. ESL0800]
MRKNLKVVLGTVIAAAMLSVPVISQAANPEPDPAGQGDILATQTAGNDASAAATPSTIGTPSTLGAPSTASAPSTSNTQSKSDCTDATGAMSHGKWTVSHSAEYNGECTLTFTATDPNVENDFTSFKSDSPDSPYAHIYTRTPQFQRVKHIVFDGVNKTKLPENSRFLFGDWNWGDGGWEPGSSLVSFKSNNHVDTSEVKNMEGLFQSDHDLSDLDLSGWDTSSLQTMRSMFDNTSMKSLDLSGLDVSNVTDMNHLFYNLNSIESLDLSGWDTSKVIDTNEMFFGTHIHTLTLGPKTRLDLIYNQWGGNPTRVTKLSDGTSGVTEATGDTTTITKWNLRNKILSDVNRAGTYTVGAVTNRTFTLNANLPQGYTADATAEGFTADANGNLTRVFPMTNAQGVPMPTYDADGNMTNHNISHNIMSSNPAVPADPFTLKANEGTSDEYTFEGWSEGPASTTATVKSGDTVDLLNSDVTLYAVWKLVPKPAPVVPPTTPSEPAQPTEPTKPTPGTSKPTKPAPSDGEQTPSESKPDKIDKTPSKSPAADATKQPTNTVRPNAPAIPIATSPVSLPMVTNAPAAPQSRIQRAVPQVAPQQAAPDQNADSAPNVIGEKNDQKKRACAAAYLQNGLVSPAAYVQCSAEGNANATATVSPTAARSNPAVGIAMLAMLIALAMFAGIFMRQNNLLIARHHEDVQH